MIDIVHKTLEQFDYDLGNILKEKYLDIILYGSSVSDNFEPNRGDIDFIVVLRDNLNDDEINSIFELHDIYRSKQYSNLEYQLEGLYYLKNVLQKPEIEFTGCYIGSTRTGWKKVTSFLNNCFDLINIKNSGITLRNNNFLIYEPTKMEIFQYVNNEIENMYDQIKKNIIPSGVVVQYVTRTFYFLKHSKIGSKKESCKEYYEQKNCSKYILECGNINWPDNFIEVDKKYQDHKNIAIELLKELKENVEKDPNYV